MYRGTKSAGNSSSLGASRLGSMPPTTKDKKTGTEALNELTVKDIESLCGASRYNTNAHEVAKCIMILVYTEKINNEFGHF